MKSIITILCLLFSTLCPEHILGVYGKLGYDAIAIGEQELAAGLQSLVRSGADFPLLCHNLHVQGTSCEDALPEGALFKAGPLIIFPY